MAVARTVLGTVLAGAETSYKTGGTPTKDLGLIKTTVVNPDSGVSESHGFGQSNGVSVNAGAVNPKGSIECDLQHGRLLEYAIFGGTTTHVDSTLDCTHTMVWAEELKSYALEQSYEMGTTDIVMDMLGVIFGSSTISTSLDGNLKFRSDWTAGDISTSETAVTSAVVNPGAPLPGFMAGLNLGAGALTCVQNWEITLNKNSKTIGGVGTRKPVFGGSHQTNVSWKATIGLEDTTQLDMLTGAAAGIIDTEPTPITATFTADNGTAAGSGQRKFSMALTGCQIKDYSVNANLGDFVLYDVSGHGLIGATTFADQVLEANW